MNIITISREFGSGGRELGRLLAESLGYDYYDREIITEIASRSGMREEYVDKMLSEHGWRHIPVTSSCSFSTAYVLQSAQAKLLSEQKAVIEKIAESDRDCVIVGRNADVLLHGLNPLNLFICADIESRITRCMERSDGENLTRKKMEREIKRIDKARAQTREILTGSKWGVRESYHLIINTTGWKLEKLAPAIAEFARCRFAEE